MHENAITNLQLKIDITKKNENLKWGRSARLRVMTKRYEGNADWRERELGCTRTFVGTCDMRFGLASWNCLWKSDLEKFESFEFMLDTRVGGDTDLCTGEPVGWTVEKIDRDCGDW
jgi:hypothetical protein